ncbi:MAG: hypothetical protein WC712_10140, partial [Candidatus Brocadiia bacterium]
GDWLGYWPPLAQSLTGEGSVVTEANGMYEAYAPMGAGIHRAAKDLKFQKLFRLERQQVGRNNAKFVFIRTKGQPDF